MNRLKPGVSFTVFGEKVSGPVYAEKLIEERGLERWWKFTSSIERINTPHLSRTYAIVAHGALRRFDLSYAVIEGAKTLSRRPSVFQRHQATYRNCNLNRSGRLFDVFMGCLFNRYSMTMRNCQFLLALILLLDGCAAKQNPAVAPTPGFNLFSKQQGIQIGQQAAAQVRKQYQVVPNQWLQDYVTRIGTRLTAQPQAQGFPYSFTLLNSKDINAFALPGGPAFVFSQLVLFADNEGQLAGVLAHEISHVALRHGTNQVSKQNLIELPTQLAGAVMGDGTMGEVLQVGLGVGLNGLFLHYSREDESEADALGTRIMAEASYNPIEMANMFEKLGAQSGPGVPRFLSDHPSPGNRVQAVDAIIRTLPQSSYGYNTGEFPRAQQLIRQLPPPPPPRPPAAQ